MDSTIKEKTVTRPHDKIVKKLFSNLKLTRDVLSLFLPDSLLELLDLSQLEVMKETYINALFDERKVDLLFKIPTKKRDGYVYILFEHQSSDDSWMPLRTLQYSCFIWEYLKNSISKGKIPIIYPIVLYNGQKKYSKPIKLKDLIHPKSVVQIFDNMLMSSFQLVDLSQIHDKDLRDKMTDRPLGIAMLLTLKHVFDDCLEITFETILQEVYKNLDNNGYRSELIHMLNYIFNEGNFQNKEKFYSVVQQEFSKNVGDNIMTLAQQERAEGKFEAKLEVAKKMLDNNLDIALIMQLTELSLAKINELKKTH